MKHQLDSAPKYFCVILNGSSANGLFMNALDTYKQGKISIFIHFRKIRGHHLQHPLPATIVEFLAQTLCDCTSSPHVSSTKMSSESALPRHSVECTVVAIACLLPLAPTGPPDAHVMDMSRSHPPKRRGGGGAQPMTPPPMRPGPSPNTRRAPSTSAGSAPTAPGHSCTPDGQGVEPAAVTPTVRRTRVGVALALRGRGAPP